MTRRRPLIVAALACVLLGPPLLSQAADAAKETSWEDLMPKDWDPMKDLRQMGDASLVQEGSVKERNLMRQMRDLWDNAPTNPKMDGTRVRLPGYVVPLEEVKGELKEFLLVPYFGACIHVPPPPANQIIHVKTAKPVRGVRAMDPVWISGTLRAAPIGTKMGTSGYRMEAEVVEPYKGP